MEAFCETPRDGKETGSSIFKRQLDEVIHKIQITQDKVAFCRNAESYTACLQFFKKRTCTAEFLLLRQIRIRDGAYEKFLSIILLRMWNFFPVVP